MKNKITSIFFVIVFITSILSSATVSDEITGLYKNTKNVKYNNEIDKKTITTFAYSDLDSYTHLATEDDINRLKKSVGVV